jgi:hypothetical protein
VICRNGSVESIKKIIGFLNEAKLDERVGMVSSPPKDFQILPIYYWQIPHHN